MKRSHFVLTAGALLVMVVLLIVATALLDPQNTSPAFAAAVDFANAAGSGDDAAALAHLSPELQAYVAANCPDGRVSACVAAYAPTDWGGFRSAVYRRSVPAGEGIWDIDLIATYETGVGASGVCIYTQARQTADDVWQITRWAGWLHCGDPASRNMATNPDTPNRAP